MKPLPILLATATLALVAAGCGGDDNSDSKTSAARGYDETGQAVSDVCTRAKAETDKLSADLNGNAKHDAPIISKLVDANQKYVDELKAIKPDAKLQATFDQYTAAVEDSQTKAEAARDAAESGDDDAYQKAVGDLSETSNVTTPLERALGAEACIDKG